MTSVSRIAVLLFLTSFITGTAFAQNSISVGANVNMVSGTAFPNGDPFQRQQNEPSVAYSSRNNLHLLSGANDYRAVDVPGLPGGRETGDSWLSYFWSTNGGATWKSTLIPGYPQDPACLSANPPVLCDYAAGADPVVRAGVNGMFYYSGIVFERTDPSRSAIFVSRFIDLNNDEGGDPIRYIDTKIIDANNDGTEFLDKSWIGVDIPRGTETKMFSVTQRDNTVVDQTVACGNIYVGYAAIRGEGSTMRSEIRMASSEDCGDTWTIQEISESETLNQGANIAINPLSGAVHVVWRRFDTVESFLGISPTGCPASPAAWEVNSDWPVSSITMGGITYSIAEAQALLGTKHRGDESIKLAYEVIAAKLNLLTGGGDPVDGFNPWHWQQDLSGLIADAEVWFDENQVGSDPKQAAKKAGQNIKKNIQEILQGSGSCTDGGGSTTASTTGETNAIIAVSSDDFGETFSDPVVVDESNTFDQGSTRFSFRTTAYPTVAADADGRIYVAWAARGFATTRNGVSEGDARIVISTSTNGTVWSNPYAIDKHGSEGHQIKPSMLFAGGQLTLVYYDFRQDVSGIYEGFVIDLPQPDRLRHTVDVRVATAAPDLVPEFTNYSLNNPSRPASRYNFLAFHDGGDPGVGQTVQVEYMVPNFPMFADGTTPFIGDYVDVAAPNLKIDEVDGKWRFAYKPDEVQVWQAVWSDNRDVRPPPDGDWSKYVAPITYEDPTTPREQSKFDPTVFIPDCRDVNFPASDFPAGSFYTGTRNQNVYSASISSGLIVAAPGNNRPLGTFERGFVVYVQNTTGLTRNFRLTLPTASGIKVSFAPIDLAPNDPLLTKDITIPPYSSAVATVFASLNVGQAREAIRVSVAELGGGALTGSVVLNSDAGAPDPLEAPTSLLDSEKHNPAILNKAYGDAGYLSAAYLDPAAGADPLQTAACTEDPTKCVLNPAVFNPAVFNPAVLNPAIFNPAIMNPAIFNPAVLNPAVFDDPDVMNPAVMNPAVMNPAILNPAILNPAVFNPAVLNPAILNPAIMNPAILNPAILNPAVMNPAILNPAVMNPAILNPAIFNSTVQETPQQVDVTFAIRNDGNATTAYDLNLEAPQLEGLDYELMVYSLNETPVTNGCTLTTEAQQQLVFNQNDPLNNSVDGSFYLEPGKEVLVTFRVRTDTDPDTQIVDPVEAFDVADLSAQVTAQPLNTDPLTQPPADQFGPPTIISSNFDTDVDGWTIANDGTPVWSATGGNPDGYFGVTDQSDGRYWYFEAPAPYLGSRSSFYSGELRYQLQQFDGFGSVINQPAVVLIGGGLTLIYDASVQGAPGRFWQSFTVPLDAAATGWHIAPNGCWTYKVSQPNLICNFSGAAPTEAQFLNVLGDLDKLLIRGEYTDGTDAAGLDNVELSSSTITNLVSLWRAEGDALDSVGGNNGTLQNGAGFAVGRIGEAFSVQNQYVRVADDPSLRMTTAMTMAAWIYPTDNGSGVNPIIVNKEGEYEFSRRADGSINWAFDGPGSGNPGPWIWRPGAPAGSAPLNTWTHVAITYNNGTVVTYVNGVVTGANGALVSEPPVPPIPTPILDFVPDKNELRIGGRQSFPNSEFFNGRIDEVRIYDTTLTAADVQDLYNSSAPFTQTVITGDFDILNDGILIAANDLGGFPASVTVNGVDFGVDPAGPAPGQWVVSGGNNFSTDVLSAALDELLNDLIFVNFGRAGVDSTFTINGLTAGNTYRLQMLFSNDLNSTADNVEVTVEGATWLLNDWQPAPINLTAIFTATGSSVDIVMTGSAAATTDEEGRGILNAYALHDVTP